MKKITLVMMIITSIFLFGCERNEIFPEPPAVEDNTDGTVPADDDDSDVLPEGSVLRVIPSEAAVSFGREYSFRAVISHTEGTEEDVTDSAVWSVSGSAETGAVPGTVIAGPTEGKVSVNASYGEVSTDMSNTGGILLVTGDVFVSTLGDDVNGTGESDSPFATIDFAVSKAVSGISIRIAQGRYTTTGITMPYDGVSLFGGYSSDWSRDRNQYRSVLTDTSTEGGVMGPMTPKAAVTIPSTATSSTVIDGLEINGASDSGVTISTSVTTSGSPVIQDCVLGGGNASNTAYGLSITGGSPRIVHCEVYGGNTQYSMGIKISGAVSVVVEGCTVETTGGTGSNMGISAQNSSGNVYLYNNLIITNSSDAATATGLGTYGSPVVANNTFVLGAANTVYGVTTAYTKGPELYNNIFYFTGGASVYGIYEGSYTGDDPLAVKNNIFHNALVLYHNSTGEDWSDIESMETGAYQNGGTEISGNIAADPVLTGGSYMLTENSPESALSGGINGLDAGWPEFPRDEATDIPMDLGGNVRPAAGEGGWSIGAWQ